MPSFVPTSAGPPRTPDAIPSYGGRPALKPSVYGWLVALYIFIAGIAGTTQILATMLDLAAQADAGFVITAGRLLAFAGAAAGGILLIVELHTPQRFYNMLRIFRPTSPMSIGSFTLTGFGLFSLLALAGEFLEWRILSLTVGIVASLLGLVLATYPAALLAATSTPLWAAAPRLLAVRFGAASMASGAAVLCIVALWSPAGVQLAAALAGVAAASVLVQLIAFLAARMVYIGRGVDRALAGPLGYLHLGAEALGGVIAVALYAAAAVFASTAVPLLLAASACVLAGGLIMRGAVLLAGNESVSRPEDYFRLTRAASPPAIRGGLP